MANKYPFLPIWVKDILGDNRFLAMSTEEVGAYFLLLLTAWQEEPPATLPNDDVTLARIARCDAGRWQGCRDKVLSCFAKSRDGSRLVQKRLLEEYEKAEKRSQAGRTGAEKRWGMRSQCGRNAVASKSHDDRIPVCELLGMEKVSQGEAEQLRARECGTADPGPGTPGLEPPMGRILGDPGTMLPALEAAAIDLGAEWSFRLTHWRAGAPRESPDVACKFFAEMMRLGFTAEALLKEVKRADRDRNEQLWEFRKRLQANQEPGNGLGRSSRLRDPGKSYAHRTRKVSAAAPEKQAGEKGVDSG